jgi:hypothetical protein
MVSQREKEAKVARARAPITFCAFYLYKQSYSDNRVALEIEQAAIF